MADFLAGLLAVVAPVFLISAGGFVWRKRNLPFDQLMVTNMVTLVGAPCLVFSTMTRARLPGAEILLTGGATLACLALTSAIACAGLWLVKMPFRVYLPSLIFPNIGNLGLPVCLFAFGAEGMALAMIYFAITTVAQFTAGPAIAAGRFNLGMLLRLPFLYAVILSLGLGALEISIPRWLANTVDLAGGLAVPLMLMALGAALADFKVANLVRASVVSAARIVMGIAVGWLVAAAFGLEGAHKGVVILESSMPVAVFNFLFARLYGNGPDEVAGLVLMSTLFSLVSLPILIAMVM
jgi:predicted permease